MTKKVIKIVSGVFFVLVIGSGAFAKSIHFSTYVSSSNAPVFPLFIETPEIIIDWFKAQGLAVDEYSSDIRYMPVDYRDEIRDLYEDNKATLDEIAQEVLTSHLKEDSVEYVKTSYGPITWVVQYNQ